MGTLARVTAALLFGGLVLIGAAPKERAATACCFTNPQFAGPCLVQAAPGETCGGVLAYLNNPKGAGKAYCSNTSVRGGWRSVPCKPVRATPSPGKPPPSRGRRPARGPGRAAGSASRGSSRA